MANFARVVDGVAVDVSAEPKGHFHPDLAALFVPVPPDVEVGWRLKGDTWAGPDAAPTEGGASVYRTVMTPIRFKAQFGLQAQVNIARARAYQGDDAEKSFGRDLLNVLFGQLDDPRLMEVDVKDPSVIAGIDFVHSFGIISKDEADAIKRGIPE